MIKPNHNKVETEKNKCVVFHNSFIERWQKELASILNITVNV